MSFKEYINLGKEYVNVGIGVTLVSVGTIELLKDLASCISPGGESLEKVIGLSASAALVTGGYFLINSGMHALEEFQNIFWPHYIREKKEDLTLPYGGWDKSPSPLLERSLDRCRKQIK